MRILIMINFVVTILSRKFYLLLFWEIFYIFISTTHFDVLIFIQYQFFEKILFLFIIN